MNCYLQRLTIGLTFVLSCILAMALPAKAETSSDQDGWEFGGSAYLWAAGVEIIMMPRGRTEAGVFVHLASKNGLPESYATELRHIVRKEIYDPFLLVNVIMVQSILIDFEDENKIFRCKELLTTTKKPNTYHSHRSKFMKRLINGLGKALIRFCLLAMAGWATVAIFYSNLPVLIRPWVAGIFAISSLLVLVGKYSSRRTRLGFLAAFALVLTWWLLMPPSNNRDWQPDLATLSWADITGDKVTIHNIRNSDYRTETDFTVRHYDKTFDLSHLKGVDLFLVYWGSPKIAHTMMSFDFGIQGNVCFSIETRKEKGEDYSTIKGFFRQYEIIYIVADERDLVRLRTNYREKGKGEDVYLYRLNASPEVARKVFLSYLGEVNRLKEQPQWYNALTGNCTTSIRQHTMPYNPNARLDWRLVVNGYIDEMLYERKTINTSLPFAELKKRSYINPKAQAADKNPAFSQLIRVGLPGKELK